MGEAWVESCRGASGELAAIWDGRICLDDSCGNGEKMMLEEHHEQQRLRWDREKGYGVPFEDDDGGNKLLAYFSDREEKEWKEETEKQRSCGYWYSHKKIGERCILCEAVFLR